MCSHRGHTHSLFWEFLYAIPLAYLFYKLFKENIPLLQWFLLFIVCLWGHSLLDTCTVYGTRLFLPFTQHAYTWNTLSIVDILFTAPMFIMMVAGLFCRNDSRGRHWLVNGTLLYFIAYLGLTLSHKYTANRIIEKSMQANHLTYKQHMTGPTILNNLLWYGMASDDSTLSVGEMTLLKQEKPIEWLTFPRNQYLLDHHPDTAHAKLLKWFSNGYSICQQNGDTLNVYCVKFGRTNLSEKDMQKTFVFHYKLYQEKGKWQMGMEEPNSKNADMKQGFRDLLRHINGDY